MTQEIRDTLYSDIDCLVKYAVKRGLIEDCERIYSINLLIDLFHENEYKEPETDDERDLETVLDSLDDIAVSLGLIDDNKVSRDLFDTRIMNCVMMRPAEVRRRFMEEYRVSPEKATDFFYSLSKNSNYIRTARVAKDIKWKTPTEYGDIDITINLSKPEKDPKVIAAALKQGNSSYPRCQLCIENEGYAGRLDHPARQTLRIIPVSLRGEQYGFQYSPYSYFNEHCIVLNSKHVPMKVDKDTFLKLFDFVRQFPSYFLGSNADLPIVGGSILTHDHFQGGKYEFAMERAKEERGFTVKGYDDVKACLLHWPVSVIRLRGAEIERVADLANHILSVWRGYTDESVNIFAETDGEPHNTITPIARKRGDEYEMDLALRNNLTTKDRPLGLFHPRAEYHHIKKENIGLIEVMGLAVLPSRLQRELALVESYMVNNDIDGIRKDESVNSHADWAEDIMGRYDITSENVREIIRYETGMVFCHVLEDAGVFKKTDEGEAAFFRFIDSL